MKKLFFSAMLLFFGVYLMAQQHSDSIEVTKSMGVVFKQHGQKLNARQMLTIMKDHPQAYQEMKIAKTNLDVGNVFGFIGGAMIGWTLGSALGGKEVNWAIAGAGAGVIAIAIPFSVKYSKRAKTAVQLYNSGLKQAPLTSLPMKAFFTGNSFGVAIVL